MERIDLQPAHDAPTTFLSKYVFSLDHKVIAKQFIWVGLIFLAFGGTEAMLIRWQQFCSTGLPNARREPDISNCK